MTPETRLPDPRTIRAMRRGIAACLALALALFSTAASARQAQQAAPPAASSLNKPIAIIQDAFRAGRPEALTALLPADGRIFLSLGSVGGAAGYYSRDQVYFILSAIFSRRDTVDFAVRPLKTSEQPRDEKTPREGSQLVYCISMWTYHGHDGVDGETQIHFVLQMKNATWSLVEIREAR